MSPHGDRAEHFDIEMFRPPTRAYPACGSLAKFISDRLLGQADGGNPVETHARPGTPYSFLQSLDIGLQCWKLRRLDQSDEAGMPVITRKDFMQVVSDCSVL